MPCSTPLSCFQSSPVQSKYCVVKMSEKKRNENIPAELLAVGDSIVDQMGVVGLLGSSQDQRGVGGGISGLVLGNGYKGDTQQRNKLISISLFFFVHSFRVVRARHNGQSVCSHCLIFTLKVTSVRDNGGKGLELVEGRHGGFGM